MEKPVWVIGHRNPDTDAICSAIAYADLLKRTRYPTARAACCGTPNSRTEWVLQQAALPAPRLMSNIYPRAADFCQRNVVRASPDDTVISAYARMTKHGHRSVPVTDENGILIGMLSLLDLLSLLIPPLDNGEPARQVTTTTEKIREVIDADALNLTDESRTETDFLMMVAGSSEPVMRDRIADLPADRLLIITGDRVGVQLIAVEAGVRCLVITSDFRPSDAIIAAARAAGTAILVTGKDTASTTQLIRGARPIHHATSQGYLWFSPDATVNKIKEKIKGMPGQTLFPVCDPSTKRLIGVFSRTDLVNPERPRLVLVDHNEFSQAIPGADESDVVEVIDHHRLSGNLVTREPVQFINKPVGSTCTIVGRSFQNHDLVPEKAIAVMICAGIISDTLNLTSPTATPEDERILSWAAEIAEIDVNQFTDDFFAVGSILRLDDARKAILSDRKDFTEKGYHLSISQVEEVDLSYFWPAREELQSALRDLIRELQIDFACLMVTDITRNNSMLLVEGPLKIRERFTYPTDDFFLFTLNGVVSRKKQLFPYISMLLTDIAQE